MAIRVSRDWLVCRDKLAVPVPLDGRDLAVSRDKTASGELWGHPEILDQRDSRVKLASVVRTASRAIQVTLVQLDFRDRLDRPDLEAILGRKASVVLPVRTAGKEFVVSKENQGHKEHREVLDLLDRVAEL